jgi:hypothetical protein
LNTGSGNQEGHHAAEHGHDKIRAGRGGHSLRGVRSQRDYRGSWQSGTALAGRKLSTKVDYSICFCNFVQNFWKNFHPSKK